MAATSVRIEWSGIASLKGAQTISVMDVEGKEMAHATGDSDRYKLDVTTLPNGAYSVTVGGEHGSFSVRRR